MRERLPIVVSASALLVAVFGSTPLGHAASRAIHAVPPFAKTASFAKFAGNASKLNGRKSTLSGAPGTIPVVGKNGKLPTSIGTVGLQGSQGPVGPRGPTGLAGTKGDKGDTGASGATKLVVRTASSSTAGFTIARVDCLAGEFATGGGVFIPTTTAIPRISRPIAGTGDIPTGWEGSLQYSATTQSIQVYAVCASP